MKESKQLMRQAVYEGMCTAHVSSARFASAVAELPQRVKTLLLAGLVLGMIGFNSTFAWAAACDTDGNGAAKILVDIIEGIAFFLVLVGGGLALLFFAIGAVRIITSGVVEDKKKGFDNIKNAIIGLVILAAGLLIRFVVVELVSGIGQSAGAGNTCDPISS